jgi:biotin-(acetyl-CoA carboxylase) ligase
MKTDLNQQIFSFQDLDIKLKWPNDIYANSDVKIGGLIVTSLMEGNEAICNVGKFKTVLLFSQSNYTLYRMKF